MIKAIAEIGRYVAGENVSKKDFLKLICRKLDEERNLNIKEKNEIIKKPFKQHIVILNFDTKNKKIEIDVEEVNAGEKNSAVEFLFVGNAKAASSKIYSTSDNCANVFESLLFLSDNKIIKQSFFLEYEYNSNDKKGKWFCINPKNFQNYSSSFSKQEKTKLDGNIESLINSSRKQEEQKKIKKNINVSIEKMIKKKLSLHTDEIALYTVKINGKNVAQGSKYIDAVYDAKLNRLFGKDETNTKKYFSEEAICMICNNNNVKTTSSASNLEFKFYMTDKIGFSSNLDGSFKNNYNICKKCYQHLMIAERYIPDNLSLKIGGLSCYILPSILFEIPELDIDEFSVALKKKNNLLIKLASLTDEIEDQIDDYKNQYVANYLFHKSGGPSSKFKVLKLIKDIPPVRINEIIRAEQDILLLIKEKFNGDSYLGINLNKIYYLLPIRDDKRGNTQGHAKYLDIIDSIFSYKQINYQFVIKQFVETIRIIKYGSDDKDKKQRYSFNESDNIVYKILTMNFMLLFIQKLNLIGGIMINSTSSIQIDTVPEEITTYWDNLEIYRDNQKKALFLLGWLMSKIGSKQTYKNIKNKPILNKISFQGMGVEKLMQLTSDIEEKLRQYKPLWNYNEKVWSVSKLIIGEHINKWELSNQENTFYVMSGFAFSNYYAWTKQKIECEALLKDKQNFIEQNSNEKTNSDWEQFYNEGKKLAEENKYSDAIKQLKQIKKEDK